MKRREFIAAIGGAAAWPFAARAQQTERMRRVGVLIAGGDEDDPDSKERYNAFVQRLQQLNWINGRNVRLDTRWPVASSERNRRYAAELAALAST